MAGASTKVPEDQEAHLNEDVVEEILSHVPLLDLVPASHVSTAWKRAVLSSHRLLNRLEPWLTVHTQSTRPPHATTTRAYDPRSQMWIEIKQPPIHYISALRSSHSNLLYMLSPSMLSFSVDPLHLKWHHAAGPTVWRVDPVVALVGRRVVVAGSSCGFEDDPLAVEIYDIESRVWDTSESMPVVLKYSAASEWLSVATDDRSLFVMEKNSGKMHAFDPETKKWRGPYDLRSNDASVFSYAITCFQDHLILIGLDGDAERVQGVKLWKVNCETFEHEWIGEMPPLFVEKLERESDPLSSAGVCLAGNVMYIYNSSMIEEVIMCEFVDDGDCRWRSVVANERSVMERVVITCSEVGIRDVHTALVAEHKRFVAEFCDINGGESLVRVDTDRLEKS
ncbi:F-box/kelch-repeat protein [Actinidia chinensis var. chinensis]|uniref:F-box/kelch-repeat protein n=1 Tax=Actinidia chinensis var. chinensis TaxID=1590841 RepID=A0A2R6REP8_ACTCC|nr:F-box/kelch-repeat protein [Actinidia chinensis var. chinensis]